MSDAAIIGPDPSGLSDDELYRAAQWLASLAQFIATGKHDEQVTAGRVARLDPVRRFLVGHLEVGWQVLVNENARRWGADDAELIAGVEEYLRTLNLDEEG